MKIKNKSQAWVLWLRCSIFFAYQYILRVIPNILISDLMERLNIEANKIGQISGWYYVGYSIMHLPLGILLDRFNAKYILPIFVFLASIGTLPLIYAESWQILALGRLIVGIGSSAAILGLFKIIQLGFEDNKFSFMLGLSVTIGLSGALYGGRPMQYLIDILGYKLALLYLIGVGMILSLLLFILVPKYDSKIDKISSIIEDIKKLFTNCKFVLLCFIGGFMVGPIEGFADTWATEFFKKVYNFNKETASYRPSTIFIGMCFGAPLIALFADKTKAYLLTLFICAIGMGVGLLLIIFNHISELNIIIILTIIGMLSSYQSITIYKAASYVIDNLKSLAAASANMIIMIFGYLFHNLIGIAIEFFSENKTIEGKHLYSVSAYQSAMSIIPVGCIIASIALVLFKLYEHQYKKPKSTLNLKILS